MEKKALMTYNDRVVYRYYVGRNIPKIGDMSKEEFGKVPDEVPHCNFEIGKKDEEI